jgi:large subunit ribosomal protein L31
MKPNIHPDYHPVTLVMTNGDNLTINSTYGKSGDRLLLDVDYRTHPAWVGGTAQVNQKASKVASFNKRFSGIGFATTAAPAAAATSSTEDEAKA